MKGNWGSAILLYVVSCVLYVPYGILNRGGAIAGLAVLLLIFVYLPINFGLLRTFLAFARDKRPLTIEGLFCAFNNTYYWKAIGTGLLSGIYTFLWTLLLIVPGIIKGCRMQWRCTSYPTIRKSAATRRSNAVWQ